MSQSSNVKPKIFICGLSWVRGEWSPTQPVIIHKGLEQYFIDRGYTVINKSRPRSFHSQILDMLAQELESKYTDGDIIFFVQTDPMLDVIHPESVELGIKRTVEQSVSLPKLTKKILDAGGLKNLIKLTQEQIYAKVDSIAKKYNTVIHCIGGSYNINTTIIEQFSNLNPIVPSWVNLLVGQYKEYHDLVNQPDFGIINTWGMGYLDVSQFSPELAKQVDKEMSTLTANRVILNELIFHPDGNHPNREGHKMLFDYLVKELNL